MTMQPRKTAIFDPQDGLLLPYRRGVGVIIINSHGETLAFERVQEHGAWQWPQGGIDEGEEPEVAAWRELYEETGLTDAHVTPLGLLPQQTSYLYADYESSEAFAAKNKYRGQIHDWFVFRAKDDAAVVNAVRFDMVPHEVEFRAVRWQTAHTLAEDIIAFKKDIYQQVVGMLGNFLKGGAPASRTTVKPAQLPKP